MLADKLTPYRQSLETGLNLNASNLFKSKGTRLENKDRDSARISGIRGDIIDVNNAELSEDNKKMLEAFKMNSGYYNSSPKKSGVNRLKNDHQVSKNGKDLGTACNKIQEKQCKRLYLFNHKEGDYQTKEQQLRQSYPQAPNVGTVATTNLYVSNIQQKKHQFIKQLLQSLGLVNETQSRLQFCYLIQAAYGRFIEMKSNGRWELIVKNFKNTQQDQDFIHSNANTNRSIIKKKSILDTQTTSVGEKKKVKLVQPQSSSQLMQTKSKLAQDLQAYLKKLTQGYKFQKYCYSTQKVEQINIYLSYDLRCLAWKSKSKQQPQIENMLDYSGITDGPRSKNYSKYLAKSFPIDEQLAFSIVLKNRTLDLLAYSLEEKRDFVQGMKFARSCL